MYTCVYLSVFLTSAPPASGVCVCSLQVREAVREILVVAVFGLLDHFVLWIKTKQHVHIQMSHALTANTSHKYSQKPVKHTHEDNTLKDKTHLGNLGLKKVENLRTHLLGAMNIHVQFHENNPQDTLI